MRILTTAFVAMAFCGQAARAGEPTPLPAHHAPHAIPQSQLAPPTALTGRARFYGGSPIDVLNYHYDNNRTGWNQAETDLTPASVASSNFGLLEKLEVDGNVFAQPMLVTAYTMPDGSVHDVLIIATGHDTVWAFDAQTYKRLWKISLGKPQDSHDVKCGDILPEYGITSTPVILRNNGKAIIYVVAATEPSQDQFETSLHALDLGTGADVVPPVVISPSATLSNGKALNFDPQHQYVKAGLATAGGGIYVAISSHCDRDKGDIAGWLLRYDTTSLANTVQFHTIDRSLASLELASVWMSGFAPAIDANGNLFVVTGNGGVKASLGDWGESVLHLPAGLTGVTDSFTPSAYKMENKTDDDFGSGGVMLLPTVAGQTAPPMAVAMGKDGVLYLLSQTNLGGLKPNDSGALQSQRLAPSGSGTWGGPAFYNSPVAGPLVYEQTDSDVLRAFSVATGTTPALKQIAAGTTNAGYGGSLPIVSSNGATAGTGVVWLVRRSSPPSVEAYNADSLGAPIFSADIGKWSNPSGNSFLTPMVANGRVYVPGYRAVSVFGLQQ